MEAISDLIHRKLEEQIWRRDRLHYLSKSSKLLDFRSINQIGLYVHFDAGWILLTHQTTAGIVVHFGNGSPLAAAALNLGPTESALYAVASGCLEGLRLALSISSSSVEAITMIGDSKIVIEEIEEATRGRKRREEGGCREVMNVIHEICAEMEWVGFQVSGRESNVMADYLATHVVHSVNEGRWTEKLPDWLIRRCDKEIYFAFS